MMTPYEQLIESVIWALREFGECTTTQLTEITGWPRESVRKEMQRIMNHCVLKHWVQKKKGINNENIYRISPIVKGSSIEFLHDIARKTFDDFNRGKKVERIPV